MAVSIERFKVTGLHGRLDVDIPIVNNRILLVGVNGLGKTTIVSMLFFLLTKQWERLGAFTFESVELTIGGKSVVLERSDMLTDSKARKQLMRMAMAGDAEGVMHFLQMMSADERFEEVDKRLSDRISREIMHSISAGAELSPSRLRFLLQRHPMFRGGVRISRRVVEVSDQIDAAGLRVLYMPTYRRIEQDLEDIFPGMSGELQQNIRSKVRRHERGAGHVELVEFGMSDVEANLVSATDRIRDNSRIEFSNLAGSYLRDVIRGEARGWDRKRVVGLTDEQASAILSRVEENTLLPDDRNKILDAIRRARTQTDLQDDDQLLAHFFWKLTQIFDRQKQLESPIREFIQYCNKYLAGKRFHFDEAQLTVSCSLPNGDDIKLKDLSSGEKQIVSLFAQLLLDAKQQWSVIIDEPELSLSVAWQKTLLPDILATGRCAFMAAVTHSPFIFDNDLLVATADLSTLTKVRRELG